MSEKWVTIEVSRNQVKTDNLYHNEKTDKDYARVIGPGGSSFLYPIDGLLAKDDDPQKLYFVRPVGTEILLTFSKKIEGVPDDAPDKDKYENIERIMKIEDLAAAYADDRRAFAELNSDFVNMTVPTEWGTPVHSNEKGDLIKISVPVEKVYYSFLIPADHFKPSKRDEGMSYFGFPKKKQDTGEDFTIKMQHGEKQPDGSYINSDKIVSSMELKKIVDEAVERSNFLDKFVSATISEKLVRPFTSNEGKALYNVSVPVLRYGEEKETFYQIVVPEERIKPLDNEKVWLSLYKHKPDGSDFSFKASVSEKQPDGSFATVDEKMFTSTEVINCFESSLERYIKANQDKSHSLADELNGSYDKSQTENKAADHVQEQDPVQRPFRGHRGR